MPVIVTILAACVGNILGYTVFKNVVVGMYYNSYSLLAYETIWNPDAEKFDMTSLQKKGDELDEEVSIYGIQADSRYVKIPKLSGQKG